MPHLGEVILEHGLTGRARQRRGNRHPAMAPHGAYRCAGDDQWVAISVTSDEEWRGMCHAMQMPQLARNPRFTTLPARLRNQDELDDLIGRWTRRLDRYQVTRILQEHDIAAGPVLDCGGDAYDDPHLQERGYFQAVEHPDAGTHLMSGPIWRMRNRPEVRHDPAPGLGQHNAQVLGDLLGLSEDRLDMLDLARVIGSVPLPGSDMGGVRRSERQRA